MNLDGETTHDVAVLKKGAWHPVAGGRAMERRVRRPLQSFGHSRTNDGTLRIEHEALCCQ